MFLGPSGRTSPAEPGGFKRTLGAENTESECEALDGGFKEPSGSAIILGGAEPEFISADLTAIKFAGTLVP